ncbi:endonuclease domain-containing protein [Streptomyces sp. NPDC060000]|uniref:endonuclease domain-containing protein n=1 Tax=Streptomyces sp. NPDC060000 TaxID=3347031 RepID=UPI003679CA2E
MDEVTRCNAKGNDWSCTRDETSGKLVKGLCNTHYQQQRKAGSLKPIHVPRTTCALDFCTYPHFARGYCKSHYAHSLQGKELLPLQKRKAVRRTLIQEGLSFCTSCNTKKPLEHFPITSYGLPSSWCKGCQTLRRRLNKFHITVTFYKSLEELQEGRCAICRSPSAEDQGWNIDHDHECCPGIGSCGKCIRGLLCSMCNSRGIAWYERLPKELQKFHRINIYLADPPANRIYGQNLKEA